MSWKIVQVSWRLHNSGNLEQAYKVIRIYSGRYRGQSNELKHEDGSSINNYSKRGRTKIGAVCWIVV